MMKIYKCYSCYLFKGWQVSIFCCLSLLIGTQGTVYASAHSDKENNTSALSIPIKGSVRDETGNPLPGVNVLIKGTTDGISTNADGSFSINVPDETATLVFSFIGYTSQEILVGNRTEIEVQLFPDVKQLNEVVVVGYGTQRRSSVTGAVARVTSTEVSALPVASVESAIQGRVPGVSVTNNGGPGSTPLVRIRGIGSITGNSQPLYVIDGFPAVGNINSFDTKDIESVEVLKDAAASAIYGSRAANGVILITTKSGSKDNKLHVDVDSYYGVQTAWKTLDLLKRDEYIQYGTDLINNSGGTLPLRFSQLDTPIYPGATTTYAETETDWQEAMFRTAPIQQTQVSLSAGGLYTSASYFKQDGIMLGTDFKRYSYRINSDHKISKRFTFGENLNISYGSRRNENQSGGRTQLQHIIHQVPYIPIHDPTQIGGYRTADNNDGSDPENPVRVALMDVNTNNVLNLIGSAYVQAEIFEGLKYRFTGGANYSMARSMSDNPIFTDGFAGRNTHNIGDSRFTGFTSYLSNQLTYDKTIGQHTINIIAVGEKQNFTGTNLSVSGNQDNNTIGELDGSTNQAVNSGNKSETTLFSYLTRINYEFGGKYLISASLRRDGYSGFAEGHKWGNFPGLSVGWRINEETFMKAVPSISELKLRGSFGTLGSNAVGPYDYLSFISTKTTYPFNNSNASGAFFDRLPNKELTWEKTAMSNVGIDLGLFENRFTLTAEYYERKVDDLILSVTPAPSLGYSQPVVANVGSMKNRGYEFMAGYNQHNGPLTFNISANIGITRNTVKDLSNPTAELYAGSNADFGGYDITRTKAGHVIQEFYGWQTDGLFQSQAEIDSANAQDGDAASEFQDEAAPGDIRFKDINNDSTIDATDRVGLGSYLSKFNYGLNFSANFKSFDLTLFFQGVQGNKIYNGTKVLGQGMLRLFGAQTEVLDAWTPDNTNTDVPRAVSGDPNQNSRTSDRFIEDGSYLRLKNLSIGFSLPPSVLQSLTKNTINRLRIYVSSQNLLTITKYSGYDPEIGTRNGNTLTNGIDYGQFPSARTVLAGVQVGF